MKELNQQTENEEISLKELILKGKNLLLYLFKNWILIFVAVFIGGSIGFYNAWSTKSLYNAKLTFTLEGEKSNPLGAYSGLASMAGIDVGSGGGSLFSSDNIMSLMTSRKMIAKTLLSPITIKKKKITLMEYWLSFNPVRDKWYMKPEIIKLKFPLNLNPDSLSKEQNGLLANVHSSLIGSVISIIRPDKKNSFLTANCTSTNELFSKVFLETLLNEVTDFYVEMKTLRQKENVNLLQNRADSLHKVLSNSMYSSAVLIDQNINMVKQVAGVDRQKKQIDMQVISTAYIEVMRNLEIAKITLQKETPLIQVIDQPVFPLLKTDASKEKGLLAGSFFGGFLMAGLLLGLLWFKKMMNEEK